MENLEWNRRYTSFTTNTRYTQTIFRRSLPVVERIYVLPFLT